MKKLANLIGAKALGKREQQSISGGGRLNCDCGVVWSNGGWSCVKNCDDTPDE